MAVTVHENVICLTGACRVEDAETLLSLLHAGSPRCVDLTQSGHLHAAVLQVLLACRPTIIGPAADPFVQTWLSPMLREKTLS